MILTDVVNNFVIHMLVVMGNDSPQFHDILPFYFRIFPEKRRVELLNFFQKLADDLKSHTDGIQYEHTVSAQDKIVCSSNGLEALLYQLD